ncbi:MAG: hypothetical protein WAM30_01885 [Candidatus Dormiibacterota bacterium]
MAVPQPRRQVRVVSLLCPSRGVAVVGRVIEGRVGAGLAQGSHRGLLAGCAAR